MLSNPPPSASSLHARQRQHRRQNSTPSAFEAVKIAPLPNFQQRAAHMSHRRGLSLDTRRSQFSPTTPTTTIRQDYTTVSTTTTNTGSTTTPQHVLREAQQQRIARPGHGQPSYGDIASQQQQQQQQQQTQQQQQHDNFLLTPGGTPHNAHFVDTMSAQGQMADMSCLPMDAYMAMSAMMKKNHAGFANNSMASGHEFDMFGPDSALSTPTFMTFPEPSPAGSGQGWISEGETASTHSRRTSRRISNGIMDKVAKFEAMVNNTNGQRPATPPAQNANGCFPPTPMETPHDRLVKHEPQSQRPSRFSDDYDESMEETIKPMRGNRSNRNSGIFQDLRQQAEAMAQTPPRANTMPTGFTEHGLGTPGFMSMANVNAEFVKIENNYDGLAYSTDLTSDPAPMTPQMAAFGHGLFDHRPDFRPPSDFDSQSTMVPQQGHASSAAPSRRGSPHRRTESLASIASAASIASINIDETKTDTGVTLDDIAAYIEGPDPSDGKWICTFESCLKRFGRKENIKSHVQTHLNDRQYQCPSCHKCFVRQHDLKRHAKIHTGIKPYPCECGNSFARHDALTRHRQRGMCIGAFDGIVRKVVKRGRPRKNRPDLDERREKSERTRRKNKHTSSSSVSSFSGYSDSSAVNSPCNNNGFDGLMDEDTDPFPDIMDVTMSQLPTTGIMNPTSLAVSSAPMPGPSNGPETVNTASPQRLAVSPSAISNCSPASHHSQTEPAQHSSDLLAEYNLPTSSHPDNQNNPSSPAKSVASHYTHVPRTPPELSASSSPPPTTHSRYFDLSDPHSDPNSSGLSEASSIGLGTTMAAHAAASVVGCGPLISNASGAGMLGSMDDSDMSLLQFTTDEDGLVQLDHASLGKFDDLEEYGNAVNLFTNDDVFFGSS
ncbi:hypothetical protein B0T14DRAFT_340400 [Immersiella caudata]|uniref:C2H2-type domain-containing protein n=1 Tax=Immersiella caudata TaxID=314043 RepID=A0AA39T215_9PEZI|nr:hypothetical protein B0T14DRAFT_340400 [Immersiella caudata]